MEVKTQKMVDDYLEFAKNELDYHSFTVIFEYGTAVIVYNDDLSMDLTFNFHEYRDDLLRILVNYVNIDNIISECSSYFEYLKKNRIVYAIALMKLLKGPKKDAVDSGIVAQLVSNNTEVRRYEKCKDFFYFCESQEKNKSIADFIKPRVIGHINTKKEFISYHQ